ncbi:NAD(P)-dependent alcohol dehydrogenase [Streptomyces uncialis]|uniref:NAD(P)-dependent alcohol dehydrogenase n=1 Tax=Streptomyces uncialis TaxID=1048205 RepID=UPI00224FCA5A|nr:NAD(P)-dependent alcohol dehydrogenase [Streptomyces uncialis]MCX4658434.1 NAD(P)-dependent alcohol dehydrogenase [Streptomyces uncialis]
MTTRFGAAVLRSPDSPFTVEEVILGAGPADDEILVRIAGSGMCRTDLAVRRSAGRSPLPAVLGHEGAGVVVETGGPRTGLGVGDHVVLSFDSCGHCRSCLNAAPAYCDSFASLNLFGGRAENAARFTDAAGGELAPRWFGQSSFAEYAVVPARNAVRVDSALPVELLGPLGCGFLTGAGAVLHSFGAGPGDTVAVLGAGAVGLAAVMAATASGAVTVAVDRHPERLALAERFGAIPLHASSADLPGSIRRLTDGGARYALDTTASAQLINDALRALRPTGHLGLVARLHTALPLEPGTLDRGRRISHICEGDAVPGLLIPRLIGLWQAGRFPFDELIRTYPLADINEAERDCESGRVVKPVLLP